MAPRQSPWHASVLVSHVSLHVSRSVSITCLRLHPRSHFWTDALQRSLHADSSSPQIATTDRSVPEARGVVVFAGVGEIGGVLVATLGGGVGVGLGETAGVVLAGADVNASGSQPMATSSTLAIV